jgi:hypothetical protein
MRKTRRILLGVAALAVPVASVAAFSPSAVAAKPPPNPINCSLEATVNVSPPLTVKGELSSKGTDGTTSVAGTLFNCKNSANASVPNISLDLTIETPAAKPGTAAQNAGDNKKDYYLGVCGSFASTATIKDLKKAVKNLAIAGGVLKGAKPAQGTVGSDVGFTITNGTVKGGTYPTASHAAVVDAGLTNDANNSNLIGGCPSGPVSHIDIDSSQSHATV